MLSLLLTTALRPLVEVLYRYHVPRWLSAGALADQPGRWGWPSAAWSLSDGATPLVDSLPVAAKKVRDNLKARAGGSSPLGTVQKVATQIEQAATENSTTSPPRRRCAAGGGGAPPFNVRDYLWSGTHGVDVCALGQLTVVVFLDVFCTGLG